MKAWWSVLFVAQLLGTIEDRGTRRGNEQYDDGELDEALASYTQAQVAHPDAPELHYNIGNVQYRKEDFEKALEEYKTTGEAKAEIARRSNFNAGNVHYRAETWEEAVEAYSRSLRIDPGDIESRQNLELALQKLQQRQQDQQQQDQSEGDGGDSEEDESDEDTISDESEQERSAGSSSPVDNAGSWDAAPESIEMSQEEAEQILQALGQMEQAQQLAQQEQQKSKARSKGKY